ncbi:hypothetical protein PHLCEN_2v9823 [Hermanssonia centrifuga]|uniref:Uncharacterized protein n=1 Tax=Hermanssonia centrifuga TaxID=98765 RepID=A0A2R6NPI5_9APHY|nr:hypothetical protein PHLCEN_2v9823 [Hermanssonia centrifuga]
MVSSTVAPLVAYLSHSSLVILFSLSVSLLCFVGRPDTPLPLNNTTILAFFPYPIGSVGSPPASSPPLFLVSWV